MFVSELDTFLQQYDKKNPALSETQRQESDNYRAISHNRDYAHDASPHPTSIINRFLD